MLACLPPSSSQGRHQKIHINSRHSRVSIKLRAQNEGGIAFPGALKLYDEVEGGRLECRPRELLEGSIAHRTAIKAALQIVPSLSFQQVHFQLLSQHCKIEKPL